MIFTTDKFRAAWMTGGLQLIQAVTLSALALAGAIVRSAHHAV